MFLHVTPQVQSVCVAHLREGELVNRHANALLTALHGGRTFWCVQGHHLAVFNHHTILRDKGKMEEEKNFLGGLASEKCINLPVT